MAELLADAFEDDPVFTFVFPPGTTRRHRRVARRFGIDVVPGQPAAAAVERPAAKDVLAQRYHREARRPYVTGPAVRGGRAASRPDEGAWTARGQHTAAVWAHQTEGAWRVGPGCVS